MSTPAHPAPHDPQDPPRVCPVPDRPEGSTPEGSAWADIQARLAQGQATQVGQDDPLRRHYLQTLAERARGQPPAVQARLRDTLVQRLQAWPASAKATAAQRQTPVQAQGPSALAALLQDMAPTPAPSAAHPHRADPAIRLGESPRIRQLRAQLRQWAVQQQFSQAMALAPQNAGPINSHRLVLRSLERMREISPAYLQRFMVHLDSLMALHAWQQPAKGSGRPSRTRKSPRP